MTETTASTISSSDKTRGELAHREDTATVPGCHGHTTIPDIVVQKIAGLATREISGVYALGGGASRAFGALRVRIPGASASSGQGVDVEVGEHQAAADLSIVVEYGVAIGELSKAVRRNVTTAIERMTGLEVVEVNIHVNDVHIPEVGEQAVPTESARVL
ncbi:Asp23/Gls24 family envelope stress response protein [Kutzneria sp. 744]|uniref:Asp23/Gls24 family envelope stress response protein n=1 Tax=Kutzneria sp. (strain 744) TaxID=345341 RepID=UPI0003EECA13|nr:Asp23/Gls24 family envelope stress response protein [Kutzneria sp. 744]EWM12109.1 alkaline shock protein 23 [Kutzneria sp. 744]